MLISLAKIYNLTFLATLLVSFPLFAQAGYKLEMQLDMPQAKPIKMDLVLQDGKSGALNFDKASIRFTAERLPKNVVKIDAEIFSKDTKKVRQTSLLTKIGQSTTLKELGAQGKLQYSIKITPKEAKIASVKTPSRLKSVDSVKSK